MSEYRMSGGMKKSASLVLATCFLLGSSFTSLAVGAKMTSVYEGYAEATSVQTSIDDIDAVNREAMNELARLYNLDPNDIVMMDDVNMNSRGRTIDIEWNVKEGKTYMSTGFLVDEGIDITGRVVADPTDITFRTGIKDMDNIMNYAEGSDVVDFVYTAPVDGRYYFFVINPSETEKLYINAFIYK